MSIKLELSCKICLNRSFKDDERFDSYICLKCGEKQTSREMFITRVVNNENRIDR